MDNTNDGKNGLGMDNASPGDTQEELNQLSEKINALPTEQKRVAIQKAIAVILRYLMLP